MFKAKNLTPRLDRRVPWEWQLLLSSSLSLLKCWITIWRKEKDLLFSCFLFIIFNVKCSFFFLFCSRLLLLRWVSEKEAYRAKLIYLVCENVVRIKSSVRITFSTFTAIFLLLSKRLPLRYSFWIVNKNTRSHLRKTRRSLIMLLFYFCVCVSTCWHVINGSHCRSVNFSPKERYSRIIMIQCFFPVRFCVTSSWWTGVTQLVWGQERKEKMKKKKGYVGFLRPVLGQNFERGLASLSCVGFL